ncbi:hypothetical protein V8G54_022961 [Vigna mungo]|uniref:Uncharacterized protein n=1 Tax=Vigna mungo TaxID=3915 RepID=A0AAQ3N438_VIGMU
MLAHSFSTSPFLSPLPSGVAPSPAKTPGRKFRWPLPPPSLAKPIMAALLQRQGKARPKEGPIPEEKGRVVVRKRSPWIRVSVMGRILGRSSSWGRIFVIFLFIDCEDRMIFFFVYLELEMV